MKPNDFCVNDVKFRCVWGSLTTWDALNEIQKERKDKIVFSGTVEERGEGSRYAFFRDDEQGINYLIPIQESGQQTPENDIFKSAVHWWGKEAQTDMMIEEMAELTKAILNERRGRDHNIAEEMADVKIMLAQMEIIFQNAGEVEQKRREEQKQAIAEELERLDQAVAVLIETIVAPFRRPGRSADGKRGGILTALKNARAAVRRILTRIFRKGGEEH